MRVQAVIQTSAGDQIAERCEQQERTSIYGSLADLPVEYDALFSANASDSFFLSRPWFVNFCATAMDAHDELRVFAAERGTVRTPAAVLLTRCKRTSGWHASPRTLHSLSNFYSSLYSPLLSRSSPSSQSLETITAAISADEPRWDAVDLKWLDRDSPVFHELQRAFRAVGWVVQTYFCSGNWYTPTEGMSFGMYWEGLRSSVRNIAKSKSKKIERSGRARLQIFTDSNELESAIEAYQRIYASSWKVPEPYTAFIPGLIRTCAKQGWLRLGIVWVDNEPAAAQLWIVNNRKAAIYKIAYDKRFAELSVGSYLTTHMMQHVLDIDHVREVDYLTGDDKYKQDWMTHRRERWGILAMNPRTLRGAAAIARHVGGRAVKRLLLAIPRRGPKSPRHSASTVNTLKKEK